MDTAAVLVARLHVLSANQDRSVAQVRPVGRVVACDGTGVYKTYPQPEIGAIGQCDARLSVTDLGRADLLFLESWAFVPQTVR